MPLQKALIETPLTSGLQQKSDPRVDTIDTAELMTNCVKSKSGGIRKRAGCLQLVSTLRGKGFTVNEHDIVRGVNYNSGPVVFDGFKMSSYSDVRGDWTLIDAVPEMVATERIPVAAVLGVGGDIGYNASRGYYVTAFPVVGQGPPVAPSVSNIQAVITDATNNNVVLSQLIDQVGDTFLIAKVAICGNIAVVAYVASPGGIPGIYLTKIDLSNITAGWGARVLFDTVDSTTFLMFDMCALENDPTRFLLAYFKGGNSQFRAVLASTFAISKTSSKPPITGGGSFVSIAVNGRTLENCWVAYSILTGGGFHTFEAWAFDDNTGVSITAIVLDSDSSNVGFAQIGIARVSATDSVVFFTEYLTVSSPPFRNLVAARQVTAGGGGATVGAVRKTFGVMLASKPLVIPTLEGVRCYAMVNTNSSLQGTLAMLCFDFFGSGAATFGRNTASDVPGRLVCTIAPRLVKSLGVSAGGTGPGGYISVPKLVTTSLTQLVTMIYVTQLFSGGTLIISNSTGLYIQKFDYDSKTRFFGGAIANNTLLGLSAGAPFIYDGQVPIEMGYLWYPEFTIALTGGGPSTGTFSFICCYEWTDTSGAVHRSATSPPVTVTPAAQNIILTIPTIGVTWRQRNAPSVTGGNSLFMNADQAVRIVIYATQNGGTIYYQQTSVINDTSVGVITVTNPGTGATPNLLYTTGGVLDNYCPPSAKICVTHQNRWILAGCDDPTAIWPSKALTVGEAPGFNEEMNIYASGAVTALASLDEKLIVFVKRSTNAYGIEYIVGQGPFDTGASNNWTNPPEPIPAACGAIDQRSIAVFEGGCVFMSPVGAPNGGGGIFLLSRDLQVHYISGPVEDYVNVNAVCLGVVVHPNNGRIYFEMAPQDSLGSTQTGVRLVFDYIMQCWSVDSHYSFPGALDFAAARTTWSAGGIGFAPSSAGVNQPLVYWADYSGSVYRETSGVALGDSHVDRAVDGTRRWITATFQSAWFKPALSGFARFWRAQVQSDSISPASLSVTYTFDYAPSSYYSESNSWTDAQIAAFDRAPQVDIEHLVGNQKAKAIQVTLVDGPPAGGYITGQGFSWSTLTLEVGVEQSGRYVNLPSGQRG